MKRSTLKIAWFGFVFHSSSQQMDGSATKFWSILTSKITILIFSWYIISAKSSFIIFFCLSFFHWMVWSVAQDQTAVWTGGCSQEQLFIVFLNLLVRLQEVQMVTCSRWLMRAAANLHLSRCTWTALSAIRLKTPLRLRWCSSIMRPMMATSSRDAADPW